MRQIVLTLLMAFTAQVLMGQTVKMESSKLWAALADVKYEIKQDEYGDLYVPVFGEKIQKVKGELVEVEGFIIPFDGMFKPEELILSSLPISECFFCGSGGPETVMEVAMKEKLKYTDKRVKLRGTLQLNADDPNKLMYQLVDAVFVGLADSF